MNQTTSGGLGGSYRQGVWAHLARNSPDQGCSPKLSKSFNQNGKHNHLASHTDMISTGERGAIGEQAKSSHRLAWFRFSLVAITSALRPSVAKGS